MITTVAAYKGGVGKTTLAYEVAAATEAVLVDVDCECGATDLWGLDPLDRRTHPLLDRVSGVPRTRSNAGQPTIVPATPDLLTIRLSAEEVADRLLEWAAAWSPRPVVVDTMPAAVPLTIGALQAADLVVVPTVIGGQELTRLPRMLTELSQYRVTLVPNMVPRSLSEREVGRLKAAAGNNIPITSIINDFSWLPHRPRRRALVLEPRPGTRVTVAAEQFRVVAAELTDLGTNYRERL